MKRTLVAITVAFLAISCSRRDAPAIRAESQVVLSSPPEIEATGALPTRWKFESAGGSVYFTNGVDTETVTPPQSQNVMFVETWTVSSVVGESLELTTYWLVGTLRADETWWCYRYESGPGGLPDLATETLLVHTTTPAYITQFVRAAPGLGDAYLLNVRCQDVLRAADTDGDQFPDVIESMAFARADTFPELLDARFIHSRAGGLVLAPVDWSTLARGYDTGVESYGHLVDTDTDGVADVMNLWRYDPRPVVAGRPYSGQSELSVAGGDGRVVVVLRNGVELGSATVVGGAASVLLTDALSAGDDLRLMYDGADDYLDVTVMDDRPQVVEIPGLIPVGSDFELRGVNLTEDMSLEMVGPTGVIAVLAFVFVDSGKAIVTMPTGA